MTDAVPPMARIELERLAGRWHQLPLGQALSHVDAVRELAQRYADRSARAASLPVQPLPDLGPAVVMDQLAVTVYDLSRTGAAAGADTRQPHRPSCGVPPATADELTEELAGLRRRIG